MLRLSLLAYRLVVSYTAFFAVLVACGFIKVAQKMIEHIET